MRRLTLLSLVLSAMMLFSCGQALQGPPQAGSPAANNFSLVFEYGVGGAPTKNVLDTARGTFTKDMIMDPPVTVKLKLSDDDLDRIRSKMSEINFWDYPDIFEPEPRADGTGMGVTPYSSYYFKVERNGEVKEVTWENRYLYSDESSRAKNLKDLAQFIWGIITSADEYKALPEPRGGYM